MERKIEVGMVFGRLTVIESYVNQDKHLLWNHLCGCTCGEKTNVPSGNLIKGNTKSCGCLKETHGHSKGHGTSSTYSSWASMKQRCLNLNDHNYSRYGGRGIRVCERWLESFENFLEDMGEKPEGKYIALDRINPDGNYEKDNCQWLSGSDNSSKVKTDRHSKLYQQGYEEGYQQALQDLKDLQTNSKVKEI